MIIQRRSRPAHSIGVKICVPHSSFTPTPNMTPLQIAHGQGREARRRGRDADENPYDEDSVLAAHWAKGHTG
jgi:hypothetical protein